MAITDQTKTWLAQYNLLPARKTAQKTIFLYVAMIINLFLGFIVTKLNSAWLTINEFGIYSFFLNTILFSKVLLSFGLFESGARLQASIKDKEDERKISAGFIAFTAIISFLLIVLIYTSSFFFDNIFEVHISELLAYFYPLVFVVMFQAMYQGLLRGMGKIKLLGLLILSPRFLYVLSMFMLFYFNLFSLKSTLTVYFLTLFSVILLFLPALKPHFQNLKKSILKIVAELKSYGQHIYVANVMTALFQHSDKMFLAYFVNEEQLAYYALAFALTFPLAHFPNALGNASFKNYASQKVLNKRHIQATVIYIFISTAVLILLREFIIIDLFGERFQPAITSFIVLALAFAVNGISVPYTLFFKAQKMGVMVRNITFSAQTIYVLLNLLFIPLYGIVGAAFAALIAFTIDLLLYLIFYKKKF